MSAVLGFAIAAALVLARSAADDHARGLATPTCDPLPRALQVVEAPLRAVVIEMCRRAPTFRQRLARLAAQPDLVVTLVGWRSPWPDRIRAATRLTRVDGHLRAATVQVRTDDAGLIVELIAHEVEHVVEQLDGIDLHRWVGHSGVYRVGGSAATVPVETARARIVGRKVAAEYLAPPEAGVRP